jgi:hypothetical protein
MSLGNTSLHQRGEIPEITKLENGRLRVVRRFFKFTREDVDNANYGESFGDFGDLDTTGEQVANQGYADCRLIKVEVDTRFNAVSNADNAVLVKTYETLTSSFVQIKDDTISYEENGLRRVTRVSIAAAGTDFQKTVGTTSISSQIDTETAVTCYLASYEVDDTDSFRKVTEVYLEAGIISIAPNSNTPMTQHETYNIVSIGAAASTIHASSPIIKPSGTALSANATFFEPSKDNTNGLPRYSQFVVNEALVAGSVKVSEYNEYFTVTDAGEMGTSGRYALSANSGGAVLTPHALSLPQTYRRKGLVEVFLTTSNDADAEVAYNDSGVDWCSIAFSTFYTDLGDQKASVSGSFRTFNKYLKSVDLTFPATNTAYAASAGEYNATAYSDATGDTTYVTTGLFRSKVVPFVRKADGTQLYLKTNVTFS